jgi:hypothetical protein
MKKYVISILIIFLCSCVFQFRENPRAEISNGILKASIYLPDIKYGYHRGTRFDWAGIISSLEYKGHNYFGKWFDKYNPSAHNSVMGPVDAFNPINYDQISPGGSFVKIGVGSLTKRNNKPYNAFTSYPINDSGEWETNLDEGKVQYHHILNDENYPYEYTKTINFIEGKPEMVISYLLKNNGKQTIETEVFNHNFFVFDDQLIGEGCELTFTKNIYCSGENSGIGDIAEIEDNKLKILRSLGKGESVYCDSINAINNDAIDYDIKIDNHKAGAGVQIKGNRPISNLVFWCRGKTICPEPYIKIKIDPGEEFSWELEYVFYIIELLNVKNY